MPLQDRFLCHEETYLRKERFRSSLPLQKVRGKLRVSEEKYDFQNFGHSLEKNSLKTAKGSRIYGRGAGDEGSTPLLA
jgi:hypothetical protein